MTTHYLRDFVKRTSQYKTSLFCLAASCAYLLSGQPQSASAAIEELPGQNTDALKKTLKELNAKMSVCDPRSLLDRLKLKNDGLETQMFSPKNAAILLAGTDSCPGTSIPAGTSFSDTGTTVGANNTVTAINGGCSTYITVAGPDQIYRFVLPDVASRIPSCSITVVPSGGYDLSIYILGQGGGGCPAGTGNAASNCLTGSETPAVNATETIGDAQMDALPAGTYYLFIDSFYPIGDPDADGAYALTFNCTTLAPTEAMVGVGGRVTTAEGRGIGSVTVSIVLPSGESRTAVTSPFGFYHFDDVGVGQSYVFQVASKQYQFAEPAQLITVTESMENLNFVANSVGGKGQR